MSQNVANKVEDLIMPVIQGNNFDLVDVQYVKEGKEWYLRVFIDKPEGITLDDCELISREVGQLLDESEPIKTSYILEISSPGIERPLKKEKDYLRFLGSKIMVKTFDAINGQKIFVGQLKEFKEGIVTLTVNERDINISLDKIASANLTVDF
ncbi:MAG: ribosome maturation factor RimP [Clostridia bacterium]|nr:ribosome maturation factor RimP [Clostridia bacterium]MBS3971291.1 ribosome maturation factor RimP [Clostridia bacterium]